MLADLVFNHLYYFLNPYNNNYVKAALTFPRDIPGLYLSLPNCDYPRNH